MISWHKVGQKVQCIFGGRWMFKRPFGLRKRLSDGPGVGAVLIVADVVARSGEVWFQFKGRNGLFPAKCFRPVYPDIVDRLRGLEAPSPACAMANA